MVKDYKQVRIINMNLERLGIGGSPSDKFVIEDDSGNQRIAIFNSGDNGIVFFRLDNSMLLQHKDGSFYVTNIGYAARCYWIENPVFHIHDKLKVRESGYGYYVRTNGGRCYINSFMQNFIKFDKFPNTNGKPFVYTYPIEAFFKRNKNVIYTISDFRDGEKVTFDCRCNNNASTVNGLAWYRSAETGISRLTSIHDLVVEV